MKPVPTIDGAGFDDLDDFAREVSRKLLDGYDFRGNLDAFNDVLRQRFGTRRGCKDAIPRTCRAS